MNKVKINSLQALRALAFIGIFLVHAGAKIIYWSGLGVSIFFTLSGFLMYYQNDEKIVECSIRNNVFFSWKKIKKLYPLHFTTMCFVILLYLAIYAIKGCTVKQIFKLVLCIGLNITLLQSWVPYSTINTSLNGVAWYLSVTLFLYFMFPYINRFIKKKNIILLSLMCLFFLIIQILLCRFMLIYFEPDSKIYIWFMYCFPIFRLGDFFVGCCFGKLYNENSIIKKKFTYIKESVMEIVCLLVTIIVIVWQREKYDNLWVLAIQNWTTLNIFLSLIWIYFFIKCNGVITKFLTNRTTIFIGNISAYTFLIHYVVTLYFNSIINLLNLDLIGDRKCIIIILEFILTIVITVFYLKVKNKRSKVIA